MKRTMVAMAVLLAGTIAAQASSHSLDTYHDLRPTGQKPGDAAFNRDVAVCHRVSHDGDYEHDSPAMKRCIRSRDWQWQSSVWVADPAPPRQYAWGPHVLHRSYECPGRDC